MMENQQPGYSSGAAPGMMPAFQQQQQQEQLVAAHQQQLQMFWNYQRQEVEHANDFKNHQLPLARIKKIMKADEDVRMISAEAPILFAKACELFVLELTIRSWLHAEENKRRTLQKNDIAAAITRTDIFDFLVDIVPRDEAKDETVGLVAAAGVPGTAAAGVPYYYPPATAAGGVMVGQPAVMPGIDPGIYVRPAPGWPPVWQQGLPEDGGYGSSAGPGLETAQEYVAQSVAPPPPPPAAS